MTPDILEAMKWFAPNLMGSPQSYEFTWVDVGPVDFRDYDGAKRKMQTGEVPEVLLTQVLPKDVPMPFEMVGLVATHMAGTPKETKMAFTYHRSDNDMQVIMRHPSRRQLFMTQKGDISEKINTATKPIADKDFWYDGDILESAMKTPTLNGRKEADVVTEYIDLARVMYAILLYKLSEKKQVVRVYTPIPNPANDKRIRKGKKPIFEWKVIDVTAKHVLPENSAPTGKTHASPRRHVRRGHQRKLPNGTTIWIKQMMVGKIEFGYIHHSYTTGEIK